MKAGAAFGIPRRERKAFGFDREKARPISGPRLRDVPSIPREGSLLRSYGSSLVWSVADGERRLTTPPPGADVVTIPSTGLQQIPLPPGRRQTSIAVVGPPSVEEGRAFLLSARVRSSKGVPAGACVFFRILRDGLAERANVPVRDGRCEAHLRISDVPRVRYAVHFVGAPGWGGSTATTDRIEVVPR